MIVKTKCEVHDHDTKTAYAQGIPPIPAGETVILIEALTNFYGRYYLVKWKNNKYYVRDKELDFTFDESDWNMTIACPYCGHSYDTDSPRRKMIIEDINDYDQNSRHIQLMKLQELGYTETFCIKCWRRFNVNLGAFYNPFRRKCTT